jgi:hypothetical protein
MPRKRSGAAELLAALSRILKARKLRWYVFGARAAIAYGSPRVKLDVDVTVVVDSGRVPPLLVALRKARFKPRVDDVEAFLARTRVLPLWFEKTKMPLDLVVARDALELAFAERARAIDVGGLTVPVISPEDLVVAKLFAGRPRHLDDVRAVLFTQRRTLDLKHVRKLLAELDAAEDRSELLPRFERLLAEPPGSY